MKYRHRVLAFLFVLSIVTFIDRVCISVAGRTMQDDLDLSARQWGWMLGAFSLAYGGFEIWTGALGDRVGPRRILTRIVIWWSVFTALTGAVTRYWQLLVVRFLFGAGEAGAFPNAAVAVSRWFPAAERARATGTVFMGSRLGGALSPILVVPLMAAVGWRACFVIFGIIGLLWPLAWYAWFRDDPRQKSGVTATELAEIGDPAAPPASRHPLPWRIVLRRADLWWVMLMYYSCCWIAFFYLSWLHIFLERGRGFDRSNLIVLSWLPFVFGAGANLAGGWTSDFLTKRVGLRRGRRVVGCGGLLFSALFLSCAFFATGKVPTIFCLALAYAGADFMLPAAFAVCLDIGGRHAGAVTGAMNMAGQLGAFSTSVAFGYIVDATGNYNLPLLPMIAAALVGSLVWLRIDPCRPLIASPDEV